MALSDIKWDQAPGFLYESNAELHDLASVVEAGLSSGFWLRAVKPMIDARVAAVVRDQLQKAETGHADAYQRGAANGLISLQNALVALIEESRAARESEDADTGEEEEPYASRF